MELRGGEWAAPRVWHRNDGQSGACYHRRMGKTAEASGTHEDVRVAQSPEGPAIDWTGVQPDRSPIAPLNEESFIVRLRLLSERAESLTILRKAFAEQSSHGEQLPRRTEAPARPPR